MFIGFFKNNNPSSFILLPLFAIALWMIGFFSEPTGVIFFRMPLYEILAKPLLSIHFIAIFIALLLIITEAFLLNYIVNKYEILTKPSFLPALFYIVFMSTDPAMLTLHPFLFAGIFIILAIYKLVSSYQKDTAFSNAFDAGILFSLSTLFYFPSIVFLPMLAIGFILFRPFEWREWIISFFGVALPYVFVFSYYFWNDQINYKWWSVKMLVQGFNEQTQSEPSMSFYFMLGVCFLILLFSFGKLFTGILESSQKNKKGILLLLWFSAFALISVFLASKISIQSFSALAIPASVFCANYFLKIKKRWWGELLFILLLTSIFFNHIFNFL